MSRTNEAPLTPGEMELLEFDRATWKYAGVRDAAIHERFGISHTVYVQQLLALLERPAATAYDPQHVAARRRTVAKRRQVRAAEDRTLVAAEVGR